MEIIKNIKEVSDVYFDNEWDTYDGYCIETDSRKLYFVIDNVQGCCENWGYLSSEDDFGSFIGSELKNVYVTVSGYIQEVRFDTDSTLHQLLRKAGKLYRSEEEAKRYLDKDYKDLIIQEEE